jgi:FAD/FMN-containing dehydrogenase
MELYCGLLTTPDGAPVVSLMAGYNGPIAKGEKVLAAVRRFGQPVADLVAPMSYSARQHMLDDMGAHGVRRYWKSGFVDKLPDSLLDLIVERAESRISPMSALVLFNMHGAAARVSATDTAFGLRGHQWDVDVISQWTDPADDARHVAWTRDAWKKVEPYAGRAIYVNHIAGDEPDRVKTAFGPNFSRLQKVKRQYDPQNIFRRNHNIAPV